MKFALSPKHCYSTKEQEEINILSDHMNAEVSEIYSTTLKSTPMLSVSRRIILAIILCLSDVSLLPPNRNVNADTNLIKLISKQAWFKFSRDLNAVLVHHGARSLKAPITYHARKVNFRARSSQEKINTSSDFES